MERIVLPSSGVRVFGRHLSTAAILIIGIVPTVLFAMRIRSFGRPMFIFLMLVMILLATTELGTDSWIAALMTPVLKDFGSNAGNWVLIYTSAIMFVLRFCAGPIAHRISPLGLLALCAAVASVGLFWLASAGTAPIMIFLAATCYGFGKTFFWWKMGLMVLAGINAGIIHLITHKSEASWDSKAAKIAGATSIVLWIAILALGRLVAYDWMTTEYLVE